MRVVYLTDSIGTKRGGGSGLSGKRFLDLLKSRYGHVHIVSDAIREPPAAGPGHSVSLVRRRPPGFGITLPMLARYFGVRLLNLPRPHQTVFDGQSDDVLIVCNSFVGFLDGLRVVHARNVRMVCVVRGDVNSFDFQSFGGSEGSGSVLDGPLAFLERFDAHVFVSTRTKENWAKHLGGGHEAYLLPNAIDEAEVIELSARPVEEVRAELQMDPRDFHVVVVGTIQTRKGQDVFARAAGALMQALPNVRVHLVGGASPRWGGQEMVAALRDSGRDRYVIHGHREDALKFVRAADVAALVSYSEAFPRTVAEYMAMGKAIVSTPVAGADEMVLHGKTGLLVSVGDHAGLVDALASLAADAELRSRLGEAARRRYFAEYSAKCQESRFNSIFEQIEAGLKRT